METKKMRARRGQLMLSDMTADEIHKLPRAELRGLEVEVEPDVWARPERWMGENDDIEVVL